MTGNEKTNKNRLQLYMAIVMFLVSVFMTISYYLKITNAEADKLTTIAFYVWIFSIFAWFIKVIRDAKVIGKMKKDEKQVK